MSGIKGRSGRTSDPEARRQRALAGQKGGRANGGGAYSGGSGGFDPEPEPIDPERMAPDPGADFLALLPGRNPYDEVVAKTKGRFGYLDAKAREQSNGELLANEKRKQDIDLSRGKLITADESRERLRSFAEIWIAHLSSLTDACLAAVPPEHQPTARVRLDAAVRAYRAEVEAAVRG
jgi:hypothetical protein